MTFEEILDQAMAMLQRHGRVAYRTLKRQFTLDDTALEDLKEAILFAHPQVVDEAGRGLIWSAPSAVHPAPVAPPPAIPQPLDAERRQLTVLFCDLADSTRLAQQLDPEDLHQVIRAYQTACAAVIQRFAGHIAQYLGDGLLVYFGYPQAHEDDAQRAVRSGLGMIEAMRTLNTRLEQSHGVRLVVRLGIHTGLVVVGEVGSGGRQEQLALGETPNIAARLQSLAAPDTVMISAATAHLIYGYFVCQPLGALALKGMPQPLPTYQVMQESGAQSRLDVVTPRGLTPLIGRDEEVGLLHRRWDQAVAGMGQVVLLSGEAGIGKSRLLQVLKEQVAGAPHTRLECRSSPYYQNSALYPVVDLFQRALHAPPAGAAPDTLERLEQLLVPCRLAPEEVVPLFATLLALPLPAGRYPSLPLSPEQHRHKTLEALLALVLAQAAQQPVLFILEDLHWTDPSTLAWLTLLIEQSPTASLLILLTCRPEFQTPWDWRSHLTPLTLQRLTRAQIETMVARVTGGKAVPAEVMQHLAEKSDGVPLYVEEMTKAILESGVLHETHDHYTLTGPLTALAIPTTLQDSLMARLDRLEAAKGIAQLGATLGRQFSYEVLHAVSPVDEPALQWALRRLVDAELVYQRGVPPHATYLFKHALIQEIAYQSLLKSVRQQYHQRIVQVLEARFPEVVATQPELLASHAVHGDVWDKALRYFRQVGANAMTRSAYQEAMVSFEQALGALQHLPERRDTREQAIDLRLDLRTALLPIREHDRNLVTMREAHTLAESLGDPPRLARATAFLAHALWLVADLEPALTTGQRAVALSAPLGDAPLLRLAQFSLAEVYFSLGQYGAAIEGFRRNVDAFMGNRLPATSAAAHGPVLDLRWLAHSLAEVGRFTEGMAAGEEAVHIAEEIDLPYSLSHAYAGAGYLYLCQGDVSKARACYTRGWDVCQRWHILQMLPAMAPGLSAVLGLSGQGTEALALLERALGQPPPLSLLENRSPEMARLGEVYLHAGRLEEAAYYTERTCAFAHAHHDRGREAWSLQLLGAIVIRRDPHAFEQAESHDLQALGLANELGMRPLQAHCHRSLGTLYRQMGRVEPARAALSTAITLYRNMEMTFWLPETEAALAQVEGR